MADIFRKFVGNKPDKDTPQEQDSEVSKQQTRESTNGNSPAGVRKKTVIMSMPMYLRVISGSNKGKKVWVEEDRLTIGRDIGNDFVIENDNMVSGKHAELIKENGAWTITDLNSTNGTTVNGKVIQKEPLKDGVLISIGSTIMQFIEYNPGKVTADKENELKDERKTLVSRIIAVAVALIIIAVPSTFVYLKYGLQKNAVVTVEDATQAGSQDGQKLSDFEYGIAEFNKGNFEKAAGMLALVPANHERYNIAQDIVGICKNKISAKQEQQKNYEEAKKLYAEEKYVPAMTKFKQLPEGYGDSKELLDKTKKVVEQKAEKKAPVPKPQQPQVKKPVVEEKVVEKVEKKVPVREDPAEYIKKGLDFYVEGKHDEALEQLEKAVKLDPGNKDMVNLIAEIRAEKIARVKQAESVFKEGLTYSKYSDFSGKARECFQKVIELVPDKAHELNRTAREKLKELEGK
ncbi:MAG: FHA domain-containing protein [Elusimicrobiota bacterium]